MLNLKDSFITINNTSNLLQNWLVAIFVQLVMLSCLFFQIIGLFVFVLFLIYLLGYYLQTIKANIENDEFVFINWTDKKILKSGAKCFLAILIFLIVLYIVILLFATICFIPLVIISPKIDGGEYIGWLGVFIPMAITFYIVYPYLIITTPAAIANYINQNSITTPLQIIDTFKLFKKDLKTSFKTFGCLLLLFLLSLIPIFGYYFSLVGTKILAQYTKFLRMYTEKGE